jgi:hypothetical protein
MLSRKLVGAIVVLGTAIAAAPAEATNYYVYNRNDSGADSLRQAILDANNNPNVGGQDEIHFGIAGGGNGLHVIHLASDLPVINDPVIIRGYSQNGSSPAVGITPAVMKIAIDAGQVSNGLVVEANNSVIRGLVIHTAGRNGGDGVGVRLEGDDNNLEGSYIGLDGTQNTTFTHGNYGDGVQVVGDGNVVGGNEPDERNVISANGKLAGTGADGVSVVGDDNKVKGNAIGTDPVMSTGQIGNHGAGVRVEGDRNLIGRGVGTTNVISGNGTAVVIASGEDNLVQNNYVGTDRLGDVALGNSRGVVVESSGNVVGGTALFEGNVIAGTSTGAGVELLSDGNTVQQNMIGTDVWGEDPLPNLKGVHVTGDGNVIGGTTGSAGNVISANLFDGVVIDQPDVVDLNAFGNRLEDNIIGAAANGVDPLPNGDDGVAVLHGRNSIIGSTDAAHGNVIAFNEGDGVEVVDGPGNSIIGNSLFDNTGLGIELAVEEATMDLRAATTTSADWTLDAEPRTRYRIELFGSPACDDSGRGEGKTLLGSAYVQTNRNGLAGGGTALTNQPAVGEVVTATATVDVPGPVVPPAIPVNVGPAETSEFSNCEEVT